MREGWKILKVKDICEKATSNIAQKEIVDLTGDYPVYGAGGYVQNVGFYHREKPYIGIVKDGSGVGRVGTYPAKSSLLGTMQYIIPKDGYMLGYVSYLLKSLHLADFATGAAIPHIYFKEYGECEVPVPPFPEQNRIVAELDLLQGIIDKQKAQLKELDTLAQSIFYDMFGDPVENKKGWVLRKLEEVCNSITDGDHMPPPKAERGIPFITISNIDKVSRTIDFQNTFFVPREYYDKIKYDRIAEKGDLLYTVTGSYGIPVIVKDSKPFCFQRHIALLKPDATIIRTEYLCYWALSASVKQIADDCATGIAQKTVGLNSIRKFPITLPPMDIQNIFATIIEAIEHQKASINASIAETQKLFDYTMDKYFG